MFFDKSMYILKVYLIHYKLRLNANIKKNSFGQNKWHKNVLFFLSQAPTYHSFTFNLRFLCDLKHKVRLSKTVCGVFQFRFGSVFIKVYILLNKMQGFFDFRTS